MATNNAAATASGKITLEKAASDLQVTYIGANTWSTGLDDDAGDAFKVSQDAALGTNDTFIMTIAGERTMPLNPTFYATGVAEDNITGDNTVAQIGAVTAMTEIMDYGSDFYVGNGAGSPAVFTAPISGTYLFKTFLQYFIDGTGGNTTWMSLLTSNRSHFSFNLPTSNTVANFAGSNLRLATTAIIIADMDAADTAILQFASYGGAKVDDIVSSSFGGYLLG